MCRAFFLIIQPRGHGPPYRYVILGFRRGLLSAACVLCAVTVWFGPCQKAYDDTGCTADAGLYRYRFDGAIALASTAFHTRIAIDNTSFFRIIHLKNSMWAHYRTHLTADALFAVKLKRYNIF